MLTLTKKVLTKPNHETPSVTHFGSRIIINLILKLRFVQNTTNQKLIFKSSYLKLVLSSFILVAAPPTTNKQTITIIKSRNHLLSPTLHSPLEHQHQPSNSGPCARGEQWTGEKKSPEGSLIIMRMTP